MLNPFEPPWLREIVEEPGVQALHDVEAKNYLRFDDVWDALTFWLARSPEKGRMFPGQVVVNRWWIKTPPRSDSQVPQLTVMYSFTETEVLIRHLRVIP